MHFLCCMIKYDKEDIMNIICPICKQRLIKNEDSYSCRKGHSFDASKDGYLNLLVKQGHKEYGDTAVMLKARNNFLNQGYYKPLGDMLIQIISKKSIKHMIDSGCGQGYYTDMVKKALPFMDIIGVDIAKQAIKMAQKQNNDIFYIVASNQRIPIEDSSADLILNCFAPIDHGEYKRLLRKNGVLITVTPGKRHLIQLKEILYDKVYLNDVANDVKDFKLIDSSLLTYDIKIDNRSMIQSLFTMTPYYYKTPISGKERLLMLNELDCTVEFVINIYKKGE